MPGLRSATLCAALVCVPIGCGSGGGETIPPECLATEINAALTAASPGDTVSIGACTVTAALTIPPGVTLRGAGADETRLVAPANRIAVEMTPGQQATTVADLTVEAGLAAIVARGAGAAAIEGVEVEVGRGIGIGAEDLTSLAIRDTRVTGPVVPGNAADLSQIEGTDTDPSATPWTQTASHGIVLIRTDDAELDDVRVSGFAFAGATFVEAAATVWAGGGAPGNLRAGVVVHGGDATLSGLDLCGTLRGGLDPSEARAGLFVAGAVVTSAGLDVCDGEGYGLFHDGAEASHEELRVVGNGWIGVWAARSEGPFRIHGEGTEISRNTFAGIATHEATNVAIEDALIADNAEVPSGYGISAYVPAAPFVMRNLTIRLNSRAQILLDREGGEIDKSWFEAVKVEAEGAQLGVVPLDATLTQDWDDGVERNAVAEANDAAVYTQNCAVNSLVCSGNPDVDSYPFAPLEIVAPNMLIDSGISIFLR
jgi:hypothetical protein